LVVLHDISQLLNTSLTREQLVTCVALIESGVNPEALAAIIKDLRQSAETTRQESTTPARISRSEINDV
ncbi:hypothetical protein DL93DRAFT_2064125, partial [Clavulina sp. PMI_390]